MGVTTALIAVLKFEKPTTVNNVENDIKIKKNLAPVSDIKVEIEQPQPKEKKRFRLFKKRKNEKSSS